MYHDKNINQLAVVGGFFIANAADINEALKLCDDYPDAKLAEAYG